MNEAIAILATAAAAFLLNLPLGRWRARCRKLSPAWFVAVHASVPLIILLRVALSLAWIWAPLFVACAVGGQWLGGRGATSRTEHSARSKASDRS